MKSKESYAHYRKSGKCIDCPAQAEEGRVRCSSCNEKHNAKSRARYGGVEKTSPNPYGHPTNFTGKAPPAPERPRTSAERKRAGNDCNTVYPKRKPPRPTPPVFTRQQEESAALARPAPRKLEIETRAMPSVVVL